MKGPGLKLDLDVRRLWKCPQTGETIRLSGDIVSKTTQVKGETVFMQLVEEKRKLHEDPYHFDFSETAVSDQSSSERAAAAARSLDSDETEADQPAPAAEESTPDTVSESSDTVASKPDTLDTPAEQTPQASEEPVDDEETFGDGLL